MNNKWVLLISLIFSCTSTKKINSYTESDTGKFKTSFSLPVCLNFTPLPPHDSIIKKAGEYFSEKNIRVITQDQMFDLVQIQMRSVAQSTTIIPGSSPESMLSQIEKKTRYVSNLVRIDFSFVDKNSGLFKLRWYNEPMPMQLTQYSRPEWVEIDTSVTKKLPWPESLKMAVEAIIISGKLQ